ncbi:MAG: CDGSH iron-sulfur domain-containing protein [Gammaproteobacteria bacterium]|nr:CDGSH iron-sulfur domain-containing protein [Gammaproteobacteria bacterium]
MTTPVCAQKAPYALDLNAGTYWWCACGRSKNQPFCDGSHKGSEFSPRQFTLNESQKVWLCGCKQTGSPPYCNGTHKKL